MIKKIKIRIISLSIFYILLTSWFEVFFVDSKFHWLGLKQLSLNLLFFLVLYFFLKIINKYSKYPVVQLLDFTIFTLLFNFIAFFVITNFKIKYLLGINLIPVIILSSFSILVLYHSINEYFLKHFTKPFWVLYFIAVPSIIGYCLIDFRFEKAGLLNSINGITLIFVFLFYHLLFRSNARILC